MRFPWGYFYNAVTRVSRSLLDNLPAISKVYGPRLVLPLAAALPGLVDLGAALLVLGVILAFRHPQRTIIDAL